MLPSRGKPVFPSKNPCAALTPSYDSVHSIEEFNYIRGTVEGFKSISSSAEMGHLYSLARGIMAIFRPEGTSRPPKGRRAELKARGRPGSARGAENEPGAQGLRCTNHILIYLSTPYKV